MLRIQRDDMIQHLRGGVPIHRSAVPFCQGDWQIVRFGPRPVTFKKAMTSASKIESRPRMAQR
jgi:hypothetical protein